MHGPAGSAADVMPTIHGVTRLIAGFDGLEVTGGYLTLAARTALPAASVCVGADELGRMLAYLNGTSGAEDLRQRRQRHHRVPARLDDQVAVASCFSAKYTAMWFALYCAMS